MVRVRNTAENEEDKYFSSSQNPPHKPEHVSPLSSGLNRRAFLRQTTASVLVASIAACKPTVDVPTKNKQNKTTGKQDQTTIASGKFSFDAHQKQSLVAVQMQLFPNDGDGPSAKEINGLAYLEWALTDPGNQEDGDGEFIIKGIGWLDGLSEQTQGDKFINLNATQQGKVLTQISQSSTGESWMSLLLYYLIEALLLDPFYGGNPNGIGWKWLKHQPGFPTPDEKTGYRIFL